MLSIAHMATGAAIAHFAPNPIIAIPIILASHYLEDAIIHWDCGTGLSSGKKTARQALIDEFWDLGAAILFIFIVFQSGLTTFYWQVWLGSLIAILPDIIEAPSNFLAWQPAWLKPLNDFHNKFHNSTPDIALGLTPQILLLTFIYLIT